MTSFKIVKPPVVVGVCPICDRDMIEGPSFNEHHLIPRAKGGKNGPKIDLHKICHDKIHSLWTEGQLAAHYNTVERIREHEEMQKFIKWVQKKPIDFYTHTKRNGARLR